MSWFNKILFRIYLAAAYVLSYRRQKKERHDYNNIGLVCEEFFHNDLRGFGGFGKTLKNICDYYNESSNDFNFKVMLSQGLSVVKKSEVKKYHNTEVLIRPDSPFNFKFHFPRFSKMINKMKVKLFLTMDYYKSYEKYLLSSPATPILVWIRDPRDVAEWEKISTVPMELTQRDKQSKEELKELAREKESSLKNLIQLSQKLKRKIIFATNAQFLVDRAKNTYGLKDIEPYFLPNPTPLPVLNGTPRFKRPSLVFLGRLEPVKRPWIVFELAQRFKDIDFYIAGNTHFPELLNPIIKKYSHLKNLKFLGHIEDKEKNEILKKCWGIINTSVHEGLPVSFLEAFSFGKPVISCQNPDNLVEQFGYYTGEILGEGYQEKDLELFSQKINEFLANKEERERKGRRAKKFVEENYSYQKFESRLKEIMRREKIEV